MLNRLRSEHLLRAGAASGWVVLGRLIGLGWTLLLLARVGVADYGLYAMAFAAAALIAAPLDNLFHVRSLRVADDVYPAERSARAVLGAGVFGLGLAGYATVLLVPAAPVPVFVAGFALLVAGGEILFNSIKSDALRAGHPQRTFRLDAIRQAASIAVAGAYLLAVPDPDLVLAVALYVTPYLVVAAVAVRGIRLARPAYRADRREAGLMIVDALATAAYLQGDVLLIGIVASSEAAGVYSIASLIAIAATTVAQVFSQTYTERLRLGGGDPAAGPRRALWLGLSGLLGLGTAVVGAGVALVGLDGEIALALLVMSVFAALRSGSIVLTSILFVQHLDRQRVGATAVASALKLVGVALVAAPFGAVGVAAVAGVVEAGLFARFWQLVARWRPTATEATP